ncbi:MAG: putative membrane protein [Sulfurimonas sp.]|jgi:uncharacterized membrane protein|uniref:hypothetical protein n=1 Tax=Sulfurimonas sp. TaxID=2022749 RepID=UPI0039E293D8
MRDFIYQVMTDYTNLVIFLHVLSAVMWVGGMMAILVITKTAHKGVSDQRRLTGRATLIKSYFKFLSPFIVLSVITALFMALGYKDNAIAEDGFIIDFQSMEIYKSITLKGSIWGAMVMNMILMVWIIAKAEADGCKVQKSADCMWLVNTYLLPLNIIMGTAAIYIGVSIRHAF